MKFSAALIIAMVPAWCAIASGVPVTFHVTVPDSTPKDDVVYLAGNAKELGNWKADGVALKKSEKGPHVVTLDLPAGAKLEFKVTRGTWQSVEKDGNGNEIANRTYTVPTKEAHVTLVVERWASDEAANVGPTVTGQLVLHEKFASKVFGNERTIRVWLPPGYDSTDKARRYTVLYLQDGQNCFDRATSAFGHEWQLDETATRLIHEGKIEPIIMVGIDNVGLGRITEYTPVSAVNEGSIVGGEAQKYAQFLFDEVKPFVDRTYRTKPDRDHTAVGGSSLGGLVSLEIGRTHADKVSRIACVSTSLWWADEWMLKQDLSGLKTVKVWSDMGTKERAFIEQTEANLRQARALAEKLKTLGVENEYYEAPEASHNEQSWAARADRILVYLFPAKKD
jgi:predicted alpha/beta superfamily hydrolase